MCSPNRDGGGGKERVVERTVDACGARHAYMHDTCHAAAMIVMLVSLPCMYIK